MKNQNLKVKFPRAKIESIDISTMKYLALLIARNTSVDKAALKKSELRKSKLKVNDEI